MSNVPLSQNWMLFRRHKPVYNYEHNAVFKILKNKHTNMHLTFFIVLKELFNLLFLAKWDKRLISKLFLWKPFSLFVLWENIERNFVNIFGGVKTWIVKMFYVIEKSILIHRCWFKLFIGGDEIHSFDSIGNDRLRNIMDRKILICLGYK